MKRIPLLVFLLFLLQIQRTIGQSNTIGPGISLVFDGNTSHYVDIGDVYNTLTFPFTIEAWVKLDSYLPGTSAIFSSDNSPNAYTGLVIHIKQNGTVNFGFGNNTGSGSSNRGDVVTSVTIPLNQWTHIAGVANSSADLHIFINGVEASTIADGTATYVACNFSHGFIGKRTDPYNSYSFDGEIDEVRLWDIERSQSQIRENMCRKIDTTASGLIGYWKADESYLSTTVNDHTFPAENGIITGTISKITSGAPIGDESSYTYTSNWNGVVVSQSDSSGDKISAENINGNPDGVQIYLVKSLPFDTGGLGITTSFYFGVFCVRASSTPQFDVTYQYDFNNGVINSVNESTAALFRRTDGSITTWNNTGVMPDTLNNQLIKNAESNRGEYIPEVNAGPNFIASDNSVCEKFCINFSDSSTNNPTTWLWLFPGGTPASFTGQSPSQICYQTPGVYDVTLITTNANGMDTLTLLNYITVNPTPPFPVVTLSGNTLTSTAAFGYQWQFNSVDIPGATNQLYDVQQSGFYTVFISDENGCVSSATTYVLIEGIEEVNSDANVLIYPNPSNGNFMVEWLNGHMVGDVRIQVRNPLGQIVLSSEEKIDGVDWKKEIDLRRDAMHCVSTGVYLVEIKSENIFLKKKIILLK